MIFDLLTSPQGHQFDPRIKMLLVFRSARHPRSFDMQHDHVWKNVLLLPWATPVHQIPTLGAWTRLQTKITSDMFCIFHLWEHVQSLV